MFRKLFIFLFIPHEFLLLASLQTASDIFIVSIFLKNPLYHEEFLAMTDVHSVNIVEIGLTECQVIYRVKKVGFPFTIIANKTVDFAVKFEFSGFKILVVNER